VRGGAGVGVNKFIAVGMNAATLGRLDPEDFAEFKRPANLIEWVPVWRKPQIPPQTIIEIYDAGREGEWYVAQELFEDAGDPVRAARWLKAAPKSVRERILEAGRAVAAANAQAHAKPQAPSSEDFLPFAGTDAAAADHGGASQSRPPLQTFARSRSQTNCNTTRADCAEICPGKCSSGGLCMCPKNRGHCDEEFAKEEDCLYSCQGRCEPGPMNDFQCACHDSLMACRKTFNSREQCAYSCPTRCAAGEDGRFSCLCLPNNGNCNSVYGSMAGCASACPGQCAQKAPNEMFYVCGCR
jgi:hypothetical protein